MSEVTKCRAAFGHFLRLRQLRTIAPSVPYGPDKPMGKDENCLFYGCSLYEVAMPHRNEAKSFGNCFRSRLARHLLLMLLAKVLLLTMLWHVFIKPNRVSVDSERMGSHIAGASISTNRENHHDRSNGH